MKLDKVLIWDIDGPILPKEGDYDSPYMRRLRFLIKEARIMRVKMYGEECGEIPNAVKSPKDTLFLKGTTDYTWVKNMLHRTYDSTSETSKENDEELGSMTIELIQESEARYHSAIKRENPNLKYQPNEGVKDFLAEADKQGWE